MSGNVALVKAENQRAFRQGFQIEKKVAGGNCKVAGALYDRDNGNLWSAERNGELSSENFENQGALIK